MEFDVRQDAENRRQMQRFAVRLRELSAGDDSADLITAAGYVEALAEATGPKAAEERSAFCSQYEARLKERFGVTKFDPGRSGGADFDDLAQSG